MPPLARGRWADYRRSFNALCADLRTSRAQPAVQTEPAESEGVIRRQDPPATG
jgi:hypothetical protein